MSKHECNKITEPVSTEIIAPMPNEYIQRQNCTLFQAITPKIRVGNGESGVITLTNPKKSGVNLYLISAAFINLGGSNILLDIYQDAKVQGCLQSDIFIQPTNLNCIGSASPSPLFTYGSNDYVYGGININTHPLRKFDEYVINYDSLYLFPPGSNRIYTLNTVNRNGESNIRASFIWWEEKIIKSH